MVHRFIRIGVVGALLVPYACVLAQGLSTIDFVKGNYGKYATTLKLADLPDGYSAVKLTVSGTPSDPLSSLWPLMALGNRRNNTDSNKYNLAQCYWTNGDTVHALNRDFLVTYKLDLDLMSVMSQSSTNFTDDPSKPKAAEPTLKVDLVALDSIQGAQPLPDLTRVQLMAAYGVTEWAANAPGQMQARQTATLSNVRQAGLGLLMYCNDYDDYYPYVQSTKAAWYVEYPYLKTLDVFKTLNPNGGMIRFNMGISGAVSSSIPSPAETVVMYESEAWPDGRRAVGFADGHAKLVSREDWAEMSKHLTPAGLKRAAKPLPASYEKEFDKLPPRGQPASGGTTAVPAPPTTSGG